MGPCVIYLAIPTSMVKVGELFTLQIVLAAMVLSMEQLDKAYRMSANGIIRSYYLPIGMYRSLMYCECFLRIWICGSIVIL